MKCTHNEHFFGETEAESVCDCGLYTQHSYQNYVMLRAENVGLLRENMDLRACLYAHAQHPGFPQARVTNPDEPNGTCPTCGTIFGDGDPDEPVAGTGEEDAMEKIGRASWRERG